MNFSLNIIKKSLGYLWDTLINTYKKVFFFQGGIMLLKLFSRPFDVNKIVYDNGCLLWLPIMTWEKFMIH